jgi:NAD(P)H-hydrate epimerase
VRVLTAAQSRALDRTAIADLGLSPLVLMENAALGVVEALLERWPAARRVAVFCGPGNNGGDGLAVARQLATRGLEPIVFLAAFGRPLADDCRTQLDVVRRQGLPVEELEESDLAELGGLARGVDLLVDALFGTGLARPLAPPFDALVSALDLLPLPRLAIDLPSGLDASRAEPPGVALRADLTVTFVAPKVAHVLEPAAGWVGELAVADLGVPLETEVEGPALELIDAELAASWIAPRARGAHKGDFGHALLVAGSFARTGAAILAARAAVRAGAGLVTVALPRSAAGTLIAGSPEAMTVPLAENAAGEATAAAQATIVAALAGKTALAIGPGVGTSGESGELIRGVALACEAPLLIDADGLTAFAGRAAELAARRAPTVLTPHPGELARLLAIDKSEIAADRPAARRAAAATGAVVLLKGRRTVIAEPGGDAAVNPTGTPAMASGGSGDVLTGVVVGLLAQGVDPFVAACLGAYWHGLAGELAEEELGGPAVPAATLAEFLPRAFRRLAARE